MADAPPDPNKTNKDLASPEPTSPTLNPSPPSDPDKEVPFGVAADSPTTEEASSTPTKENTQDEASGPAEQTKPPSLEPKEPAIEYYQPAVEPKAEATPTPPTTPTEPTNPLVSTAPSGLPSSETEPTPPAAETSPTPISSPVPSKEQPGVEVGPAWLRTDPNVKAAQESGTFSETPDLSPPTTQPAPLPWQVPSEKIGGGPETFEDKQNKGGFPAILFLILVLLIVGAVLAYLYIQGSLPFLNR